MAAPTYFSVAPINPLYPDKNHALAEAFDIGNYVFVGPMSPWMREGDVLEGFGLRKEAFQKAEFAFVIETEDPTFAESDKRHNALRLANLSLWLARPTAICFDIMVQGCRHGNQNRLLEKTPVVSPLGFLEVDANNSLGECHLTTARQLNIAINSAPRPGPLWTAIRTLWAALIQKWDGHYIFRWTALEALFGSENRQKNSSARRHRLMARFIEPDDDIAQDNVIDVATDCYNWRCTLVHGRSMSEFNDPTSMRVSVKTQDLLLRVFRKILLSEEYRQMFGDADRLEHFLDALDAQL